VWHNQLPIRCATVDATLSSASRASLQLPSSDHSAAQTPIWHEASTKGQSAGQDRGPAVRPALLQHKSKKMPSERLPVRLPSGSCSSRTHQAVWSQFATVLPRLCFHCTLGCAWAHGPAKVQAGASSHLIFDLKCGLCCRSTAQPKCWTDAIQRIR
jgi:hypothetical protein